MASRSFIAILRRLSTTAYPAPPLPFTSATAAAATRSLLPLLPCRRRKKLLKKLSSPRAAPITKAPSFRLPSLDAILDRDAFFRFLSRSRAHLSSLPLRRLPLTLAGKLHRELGFPRGRNLARSASRHPLLFLYGPDYFSFTPLMESLLAEEQLIHDEMISTRVRNVKKFLMITVDHRVPLAKLHHCRAVFGLPDDFRDRVLDFPDDFRVAVDEDRRHVLELVNWDPALAVSAVEKAFTVNESRVRKMFRFLPPHEKVLGLDDEGVDRLYAATTFPLVSPYSDGRGLEPWTVEAEKYRVGKIHEFLSLTLEKRAWIHHIVEFKDELGLTKNTYQILKKQHRAFYLGGTEMNWAVFLKDAYAPDGMLIEKDPLVLFNEKLQHFACLKDGSGCNAVIADDSDIRKFA